MNFFNKLDTSIYFTDSKYKGVGERILSNLYEYTQKSLIALQLISLSLFLFLYDKVPNNILYLWLLLVTLLNTSRLYDSYLYINLGYRDNYKIWYYKFKYKSFLTALLWGSISILFMPYLNDIEAKMIIVLIVVGIGGGAMTTITPDIRIATIYLFLLLSPVFVYYISIDSQYSTLLALLVVLYYLLLVSVSRNIGEALIRGYIEEDYHLKAEDELSMLFKNTPIGMFHTDEKYTIIDCNVVIADMMGRPVGDIIGVSLTQLPDQGPIDALKQGLDSYRGSYTTLSGKELWIEARYSYMRDTDGNNLGCIVLIDDKTIEKKALEELNYMARHDELTSLANRRSFKEYMNELIDDEKHQDHYSVLFYLDLDQFKSINDSLGHSVGDQLLVQVANRLKVLTKDGKKLSRLGGDEFSIVLPFVSTDRSKTKEAADNCSSQIEDAFALAFLIEDMHLYIKCSIGIVIIEPKLVNIEEIVRHADISMYSAKRKGKDAVAYYNMELDHKRRETFGLQHDLCHAIENSQLRLYYQPIVAIEDDALVAAEALVRWHHPVHGVMNPNQFIPLAIESGMMDDIGWLVIEIVSRQLEDWKKSGLFHLEYISVNIDATQLQRSFFVEKFFTILESHGVKPSEVKLELTESSLIDNFEQTRETIQRLKDRGILCAIDDFGTGYSSLSYLRKFSFSLLKIDREFIKDILKTPEDITLVKSIIAIGKNLGYTIVVEGIESKEQKELLKKIDNGIRYQGFLYSKALSAVNFEKILQDKFKP